MPELLSETILELQNELDRAIDLARVLQLAIRGDQEEPTPFVRAIDLQTTLVVEKLEATKANIEKSFLHRRMTSLSGSLRPQPKRRVAKTTGK